MDLRSATLLFSATLCLAAAAQRPMHFEHQDADVVHAHELYDKAQFGAAQHEFQRIVDSEGDPNAPKRVDAEYHTALCAVKLFNDDSGDRLLNFIADHPESPRAPEVRFELFNYAFARKKWDETLEWAEKVEYTRLKPSEQGEFNFKKGYSQFREEQFTEALNEFDKVKGQPSTYAIPATYYSAHINYERGNYETALTSFEQLKGDPSFGDIVPYYIVEILFFQGRYDELNAYATPLLENPNGARRMGAISRLVGEANYRQEKYEEALPFLIKANQRAGVKREDRYILGHSYYMTGDYQQALAHLDQVTNMEDSLGQVAAYHMADAYLKLDQKTYARNAFKKVYEQDIDPKVTEDALFNYAKLSYELSYDPYHEAIRALKNYLKTYPNTKRKDEAYEFLLNVYLKTRNYEAALEALDEIGDKDLLLKEAYQKLAFDRGVELFEGRKFKDAALFFERALKYPVDKQANAKAHFWMGESYYRMGEYQSALRKYDDVRNSSGAFATQLYEQSGYSMGYCYFKQKDYAEAQIAFRRFIASSEGSAKQRTDAMVRVGDTYFVKKETAQAIKWYEDAVTKGAADRDYALYQKAVCFGLEQNWSAQLVELSKLLETAPDSRYAPDAKFRLADTHLQLEQDDEALQRFEELLADHPNSTYVRDAMLAKALIHKRKGDNETALTEFKAIVAKFPTMDGSRDALAGIENIYVELGQVSEYEAYVNSLSFVDPSTIDLDEKYYRSAEQLYFAENCVQAENGFADYLDKYPNGAYALNAHYYKGDCAYRAKRYDDALPDLEAVIAETGNHFIESALAGVSDILFRKKAWEGALGRFRELEQVASFPQNILAAQVGQMRCLREMSRMEEAATAASKVIDNPNATDDLRAEGRVLLANGVMLDGSLDAAYNQYKQVVTASINKWGAEAKFNMANIRYMQERYADAEKEIFELVQRYPTYDEWKARAFILLGDVYLGMDDRFQAKVTLQSVVDNCQIPELVAKAQARLDSILAAEAMENAGANDNENGEDEE